MLITDVLKKSLRCKKTEECFVCSDYHNKCRIFLEAPHLYTDFIKANINIPEPIQPKAEPIVTPVKISTAIKAKK